MQIGLVTYKRDKKFNMKFCRNLQRVIDITDPEWAPYWTNYKMLKKFLKALVPPDAGESSPNSDGDVSDGEDHEKDGNATTQEQPEPSSEEKMVPLTSTATATRRSTPSTTGGVVSSRAQMSSNPAEVAFFKLLNSELKKAVHFFDKALIEVEIREERVREGIDIMRKANSLMVNERWSLMAKSLYRLYKDLLLLETYAIMTYCSFSKILKKHDKITNHNTRCAFMMNVVNKANFTHYPKLLEMISRIEQLYDEVSQTLISEGKSGLYEDERLFINMIQRLNEQVLDTAEQEGADTEERKEQRRSSFSPDSKSKGGPSAQQSPTASTRSSISSQAQVSTLRSLVEENAMNKSSKDGRALVVDDKSSARKVPQEQKLEAPTATATTKDGEGGKHLLAAANNLLEPTAKRARSEL